MHCNLSTGKKRRMRTRAEITGSCAGHAGGLLRATEGFPWEIFLQQRLIGARKVTAAGSVSLWFLVTLTDASAEKITCNLLQKLLK